MAMDADDLKSAAKTLDQLIADDAPEQALLGQSFLRHFDVRIDADRLVLRER